MSRGLRISFYGDDFTGSTDAMESLARSGLRTILFTKPPTRDQLAQYPDLQAFGVAGMTRSMPPDAMEKVLRPAFASLRESGAPIVHYKVCSTFDSSPTVGSIGRVIDVGAKVFESKCIPVLVGAPSLGRYCVFGNLFARCGEESAPFRLDRHPSMSIHPKTPMDEADLLAHLGKQTEMSKALFDVLQLEMDDVQADRAFDDLEAWNRIILIDLLYERQLAKAGRLIDRLKDRNRPVFVVGSSGVEAALSAYWEAIDAIPGRADFKPAGSKGAILAVCGSCSPVTAEQIRYAADHGFLEIEIDPSHVKIDATVNAAAEALLKGVSVVMHTGMGKPEKRVDASASLAIGPALGRILREVLSKTSLGRVLIAGGDTSGAVAHALGIESMEMIAKLTRGSPLVRVSAPGSPADGIEMTFKGGQIGKQDFFTAVQRGQM